jgi:hypothetical protein
MAFPKNVLVAIVLFIILSEGDHHFQTVEEFAIPSFFRLDVVLVQIDG